MRRCQSRSYNGGNEGKKIERSFPLPLPTFVSVASLSETPSLPVPSYAEEIVHVSVLSLLLVVQIHAFEIYVHLFFMGPGRVMQERD